jgi:hypothetical protein
MNESETVVEAAPAVVEAPPEPAAEAPVIVETPERRSGLERRVLAEARAHERRSFGRRSTDHQVWGVK